MYTVFWIIGVYIYIYIYILAVDSGFRSPFRSHSSLWVLVQLYREQDLFVSWLFVCCVLIVYLFALAARKRTQTGADHRAARRTCIVWRRGKARRHQTCCYRKRATFAAAELGGETHNVSRTRARTQVLPQAQKLQAYGSGTLGAFEPTRLIIMIIFIMMIMMIIIT